MNRLAFVSSLVLTAASLRAADAMHVACAERIFADVYSRLMKK
jgi:hypothetical protein